MSSTSNLHRISNRRAESPRLRGIENQSGSSKFGSKLHVSPKLSDSNNFRELCNFGFNSEASFPESMSIVDGDILSIPVRFEWKDSGT